MVKDITSKEFKTEVLESKGVVVVDFWATWCMPCKMLAPVYKEVAMELSNAKFCKVDVDKCQDIAAKYRVASIPTIKIFKDGREVETMVGFSTKDSLVETISHYID